MSSLGVVLTIVGRVPGGLVLAECNSGRAELAAAAAASEEPVSSRPASRRHRKKEDAEQPALSFVDLHRAQAMRVVGMLTASSQPRLAIDAPDALQGRKVYYVYRMERGVCVLAVVCDSLCSNATTTTFAERRQAAFAFVDRVHAAFCAACTPQQVAAAAAPYAFLDFEATIQKLLSPQAIAYTPPAGTTAAESVVVQRSTSSSSSGAVPVSPVPLASPGAFGSGSSGSSGSSSLAGTLLEKVNTELTEARRVVADSIQDMLERGDKLSAVSSRSESLMEETSKYHSRARDFERQLWWQQRMPVIAVAAVVILFILLRIFVF